MFDRIISYSVENKFVIGILVSALAVWGLFSLQSLPIDAVPDITNNQVQVITTSPTLATQEIEQFITTPVELALQNIQQLIEVRSISRFGLSVVTVVFEDDMDQYLARQLVSERLREAEERIPANLGTPEMSPISTGLGEVFQYVLHPLEDYEDQYTLTELRTIQDWIVKRQLSGIDGVVEVNTLGGYLKQYEIAVEPDLLKSVGLSITDLYDAIQNSNENTGGAYIEKTPYTYYVRTNGIARSMSDLENIVVTVNNGNPVLVKDVAVVQIGQAPRYGALTRGGKEAVGGTVMMLKGSNSADVVERVKARVTEISKTLPEGLVITPYLDRDKLISTAIGTVKTNLIEGGLIVIFILILMLGNWRAGLIVASVIPLSMLFAVGMMKQLGISANLMSLGAIDFGLIVDGAVIIVEAILHRLKIRHGGQKLTMAQLNQEVISSSQKIRSSAAFGEIIILMVYIPILALVGIEGRMFKPMAQTVMLAISGALILSLTYVPMMSALFLKREISNKVTLADRIINWCQNLYQPALKMAMNFKSSFVGLTLLVFVLSIWSFTRMGGEFIPTLEEGDLALHQILPPGSSLSQSVEISKIIQSKLMSEFPEIEDVVTKIGSAEIPTDPMPVETGDIMVIMKPKSEWTSASSKQEMFEVMEASLKEIPGMNYEFSQPIQMRFNELMTGSRADVAVKLYGEDLDILAEKGEEAESIINELSGVGSVKVEQVLGMPQIVINYNYSRLAQYGLHIKDVNQIVRAAFAGEKAGIFYDGDRTFDIVIRLREDLRSDIESVRSLYITLKSGAQVPLSEVADVRYQNAPMQISRDDAKRRIVIGVNVGNTDVATLVKEIKRNLEDKIELPAGYYFSYGGQFENLQAANARLSIAVPIALAMIFVLLFFTFGSVSQAALIFTAIPFSAIGGIWALQLRGLPFSISAGIGFIALFGVAVLNGIVLIGYFNQLKSEGMTDLMQRITEGTRVRLRPVLLTAAVASLGFLPMAISTSGGAEVQRPLATVVIGGLITATFLTLIIIPILYYWLERWQTQKIRSIGGTGKMSLIITLVLTCHVAGFSQSRVITLEEAIDLAVDNHPDMNIASLEIDKHYLAQGIKYSPGETDIYYQGDGLFSDNPQRVSQFGITQVFEHPSLRKAKSQLGQHQYLKSQLSLELTKADLRKRVSLIYHDLCFEKEVSKLFDELILEYAEFYRITKARAEAGSDNSLNALILEDKLGEYELLRAQSKLKVTNLETQLQSVIMAKEEVTSIDELQISQEVNSGGEDSIWKTIANEEVQIQSAESDVLKAALKPDLNLGYSAQNYLESGWLTGLQGGLKLNLFRGAAKQRMQQQAIAVDQARNKVEANEVLRRQKIDQLHNEKALYQSGLESYRQRIDRVGSEMIRVAKLNYQSGEMTYMEVVNGLEQFANNRLKYWKQVLGFNRAITELEFYNK